MPFTKIEAMILESRPWETIVIHLPGGGVGLQRANADTRRKQLEEYKKKRIAELQEQIRKVENLF